MDDAHAASHPRANSLTDFLMPRIMQAIDGLEIVGDPVMTGFAFQSVDPEVNILAVADVMETKGWKMERQSNPPCLHCSIMPAHANMKRAKQFVQDARDARDVV